MLAFPYHSAPAVIRENWGKGWHLAAQDPPRRSLEQELVPALLCQVCGGAGR